MQWLPTIQQAERALLAEPVAVSIKYDGTNVGVDDGATLLGRRFLVPADASDYQGTDITDLRAFDGAAMKALMLAALHVAADALREEGGAGVGAGAVAAGTDPLGVPDFRVAVYGELMCHGGYYDYQAQGLAAKWLCFGARVKLPVAPGGGGGGGGGGEGPVQGRGPGQDQGHAAAVVLRRLLCKAGFAVTKLGRTVGAKDRGEDGGIMLTLGMNNVLRDMAVAAKARDVVEVVRETSHLAMATRFRDYMVGHKGEGVVVALTGSPDPDYGGDTAISLKKWKISAEDGKRGKESVAQLLSKMERYRRLLDPGLFDLVHILHDVVSVETNLDTGIGAAKAPKAHKAKRAEQAREFIASAIKSALTKFDALEVYVVKAGGREQIKASLVAEVTADAEEASLGFPVKAGAIASAVEAVVKHAEQALVQSKAQELLEAGAVVGAAAPRRDPGASRALLGAPVDVQRRVGGGAGNAIAITVRHTSTSPDGATTATTATIRVPL